MNKALKIRGAILAVFILGAILSIYVWRSEDRHGILTVSFLNIGQGDSIFIDSPSGNQLILDGGPGKSVLRELSQVMPFYDRSINVMIESHPDADHIGGLNDVLDNYRVDTFLEPGVGAETATYKNLKTKISNLKTKTILARRGMTIDLGGGAILQILFPDRDVTGWDTNDASIVARLVYGNESFLLTGDSPSKIEKYLISLDQNSLKSTILKPGHHGSRTSTSPEYVEAVDPEYAVISAGLNNKYGHPHQETLDTLDKFGVKIFRTDLQGRITFKTDGTKLFLPF